MIIYPVMREDKNTKEQLFEELEKLRSENAELKQSQKDQLESQYLLRTFSANFPCIAFVRDKKGRILFNNRQMEQYFGVDEGELLGKTAHDLMPKDAADLVWETENRIFQTGEIIEVEELLPTGGELRNFMTTKFPLRQQDGKIYAVGGFSVDITRLKKTELALRESEERFRNITESSPLGIHMYRLEPDDRLVFIGANPAADKILGVNNNQFIGKTIEQAFPPLKDTEIPDAYRKAAAKAVPYYTEQIEYKDAQISGAFEVYAFQTSPHNMVAMFQDITDRKRTEEELRIEKIQLDQLFESAQEAIVMANNQGTALRINRDFTKLFGYTPGEAIGKPLDELIADKHLVEDAKNITKRVAKGEKVSLETVRKRKDGTSVDVSVLASPIVIDGEQVAVYGIYRDISERKSAERKIKNSLKEKELLLQEIHHRVKNNLQIISSLLRLQSRMVDDVEIQEMFEVSQDRIRTISLIHEKLHRSKDMAKIDFSEYLEGLVTHLAKIYNPPRTNIKLNFDIKKIFLDINTAIPCGLIVSELVTNALKYAFQGMETGTIDLEMRRKNGKLMLTLRDSGVGLPENMDIKKLDSLGMQIVQDLAEQLGGEINVSRDGGTTFHITL